MRNFSHYQSKILNKVLHYNDKDFSLASYFCSYAQNLGFYQMKTWKNKKNIFRFILAFFREIYSIIFASDYEIKGNLSNLSNFKSIVVTWGNDENIKDNFYIDKYFNSSSKNKSILWIVIFSGKKNFLFDDNILGIVKKKTSLYKRIKSLIFFYSNLLSKKNNLHKFTYNYFIAQKFNIIFSIIIKNLKLTKDTKLFLPYESQPFQNILIKTLKTLKKEIKIFGYIHSFPAFPSHLVKKETNPDFLIINSSDQVFTFKNFLNWSDKEIILLPSLRFKKKNNPNDLCKKIFLPINFNSIKNICKKIKYLSRIYNLKDFQVRNHPVANNSKKHQKLINEINKIISLNHNSSLDTKISIFIGSTGAIIESLLHDIRPIHIMEDVEFEIYSQKLWPSIETNFIKDNIVSYKLIGKNIINIDNNFSFDHYLKLN